MFKKGIYSALALVLLSPALSSAKKAVNPPEFVPGEVIVKYKKGAKSLKGNFLKGVSSSKKIAKNIHLIKLNKKRSSDINKVLKELNSSSHVEYAEPNFIYKAIGKKAKKTTDPRFFQLWGLKNTGFNEPQSRGENSSPQGVAGVDINALNAWKITKGSKRIKIAVIDTGVDYNHLDLKANMWTNTLEKNGLPGIDDDGNGYVDDIHGYDFVDNDGDPMDGNGHGTHCAGTIAASHNNSIGIAGVMAHAQIVGVKFLGDDGSGTAAGSIAAIEYATKVGVDIMNNSWGGGGYSQALKDVIIQARDAGIVFTAAAGNSSTNNDSIEQYPANYDLDNVISVAAHNYSDELADFSCYGKTKVHVSAPGRNIASTVPGNSYSVYSGTSMATPHVTGIVGLYLSKFGKQDLKVIKNKIINSSVYSKALSRKTVSRGRVDAYNFLRNIVATRPALPVESDWKRTTVAFFSSPHPYTPNTSITRTYNVPGVKFIRVIIRKYSTEQNYDKITITDKTGDIVEEISGNGADYKTEYVEGDSITVTFESDNSVEDFGFEIDEIEYIK